MQRPSDPYARTLTGHCLRYPLPPLPTPLLGNRAVLSMLAPLGSGEEDLRNILDR